MHGFAGSITDLAHKDKFAHRTTFVRDDAPSLCHVRCWSIFRRSGHRFAAENATAQREI